MTPNSKPPIEPANVVEPAGSKEEARATLRALVIELARIAATEDDAAEQRRDMASSC